MKINDYLKAEYVSKVYSKNPKEQWRTFETPHAKYKTAELKKKLPFLKKLFKNSARIRVEWFDSSAGYYGIHGIRFYFPHEMKWKDVEKLFKALMAEKESSNLTIEVKNEKDPKQDIVTTVDENELYEEIIRTLKIGENDTPCGKGYCTNEEDLEKLRTLIRNIRVLDK